MMRQRWIIVALLAGAALICGFLFLIATTAPDPANHRRALAIARMTTGLVVIWAGIGGALMFRLRHRIRALVLAIALGWRLKFVLFATLLACLEEAVTVTMTNLAPLFGSRIGEAYITASTNYLDVITFHSVVVFIPCFIVMAALLARYRFSAFAVMLGFGLVGTCAEFIFAATPAMFLAFPLWSMVYGLMVWLPAFCLPERPTARPPGAVAHLLLAPAILILSLPMVAPLVWLIAVVLKHPAIDFAP